MGLCYDFYSPSSGKQIASDKYAISMAVFDDCPSCAVIYNCSTSCIKDWTIDKDSKLYKEYYTPYNWDYFCCYCSLDDAEKIEEENKDEWFGTTKFLTTMIKENNDVGLIIIFDV